MTADDDWGLLYGFGLFETLRVYDGVPMLLDEHLDRLFGSAGTIGLTIPAGRQELAARARELCAGLGERVVRVTVTYGNPDTGLAPRVLMSSRHPPDLTADRQHGVEVAVATSRRDERAALVRHKTLNQLQNVLEWQWARALGCRDALFLNGSGHLAEGTRSNVFLVRKGEVLTPSDDCGILPGITRRLVIDALRTAGVTVRETTVTWEDLLASDECFLTSAVMEVLPARVVGGRRFPDPCPGPVTIMAGGAYAARRALVAARAWGPAASALAPPAAAGSPART